MEELSFPKFDYYLDESDPDVVILRRQDGSFVAAFSARGATREGIVEAAKEDYGRLVETSADLLGLRGDGDQKRNAQPWSALIHLSAWKFFLGSLDTSWGQSLFTSSDLHAAPQHVVSSHAAWLASKGILSPLRGRCMHDRASELRRIPLLGTSVNSFA
jgi:hypothetical protein